MTVNFQQPHNQSCIICLTVSCNRRRRQWISRGVSHNSDLKDSHTHTRCLWHVTTMSNVSQWKMLFHIHIYRVGHCVDGVQKTLIIPTYPKVRKGSKITNIQFFIFLLSWFDEIFEPTVFVWFHLFSIFSDKSYIWKVIVQYHIFHHGLQMFWIWVPF